MQISDRVKEYIEDVFAVVEGDDFAIQCLWEKHSKEVEWKSENSGFLAIVGEIDNRPICISLRKAIIEGEKILFYYPTSTAVDWDQIEKWLEVNANEAWKNKTDASNFHIVLHKVL